MKVAVIDGLGGGIGKVLVDKIRKEFQDDIEYGPLGLIPQLLHLWLRQALTRVLPEKTLSDAILIKSKSL